MTILHPTARVAVSTRAKAAGGLYGVVVEQKQISSSGNARGLIASSSEARINWIAQDDRVLEAFEESVCVIPRCVVDDDELARDAAVAQVGFETARGNTVGLEARAKRSLAAVRRALRATGAATSLATTRTMKPRKPWMQILCTAR